MREITENPEKTLDSILSQYQAIQSEMNRKPGPNTLPGITIKDSAPCTLHAVNQCASQICTKTAKRFNGINNPKIREEKKRGSKNTCKITSLDQFRGQAAMRFIGMNQKELKSNLKGMR